MELFITYNKKIAQSEGFWCHLLSLLPVQCYRVRAATVLKTYAQWPALVQETKAEAKAA